MTTHYFESAGGRIAFDDSGKGPLVLCSPSMGDLRAEYRFLTPQLSAAGYRVVTMDVRGHGESSTDWQDYSVAGVGADMLALIRSLNAGPAVIIGTSMSAGAGVWAAAEGPDCVAGLLLIGPFVSGETPGVMRLAVSAMLARPWGPSFWLRYFGTLFPTRKPADFAVYAAALKANLSEPGRIESLQKMMPASKRTSGERMPRVTAPTLVLMGSKDPDFRDPEGEARRVADGLRGTWRMIDGAGHYPHVEMPEVSGPLVTEFLGTLRLNGGWRAHAA